MASEWIQRLLGAKIKSVLRKTWLQKRASLSAAARLEAEECALKKLPEILIPHKQILSYASFQTEFNTHKLNLWLALEKRLILPKVSGTELHLYQVENPAEQLKESSLGILEPIPSLCKEVPLSEIDCVLVPGIAFDSQGHRLGYGGGFYDRLLPKLNAKTFGLGYKEQLSPEPLPKETHDIALDELLLF